MLNLYIKIPILLGALFIIITIFLSYGCIISYPIENPVTEDLIETVVIADQTLQFEWIYNNAYWNSEVGEPNGCKNSDIFKDSDREYLMDMIKGNLEYRSYYKGNRAIIVVNVFDSGIPQWIKTNIFNKQSNKIKSSLSLRNRVYHFIFIDGKWKYVPFAFDDKWPEPEFF